MAVQGISHSLFLTLFVPTIAPLYGFTPSTGKQYTLSEDLFLVSMAFYFTQLHHLIMESWKQFGETQKAVAQENSKTHRRREKRKIEQEAIHLEELRRESILQVAPHDKILLQSSYRQATQFRSFEGHYLTDGNCHLNFPI